jgi:hypothetical protein
LSSVGITRSQIVTEYGLPPPLTLSSVTAEQDANITSQAPSTPTFRATSVLLSPSQLQQLLSDTTKQIAYIEQDHAIQVDPIDMIPIPDITTQNATLQRNHLTIEDEDTTNVSVNKAYVRDM